MFLEPEQVFFGTGSRKVVSPRESRARWEACSGQKRDTATGQTGITQSFYQIIGAWVAHVLPRAGQQGPWSKGGPYIIRAIPDRVGSQGSLPLSQPIPFYGDSERVDRFCECVFLRF